VAHETAVSKNVAEALKNFQAKHHFISSAIYRIVDGWKEASQGRLPFSSPRTTH
jgi:hypothetical protein